MDNERIRAICLGLPYVAETVNWGITWCIGWATGTSAEDVCHDGPGWDGDGGALVSLRRGAVPRVARDRRNYRSPYLAKAGWVTVERWDALRPREIEKETAVGACADL